MGEILIYGHKIVLRKIFVRNICGKGYQLLEKLKLNIKYWY